MSIDVLLETGLQKLAIPAGEKKRSLLCRYAEILLAWNQKMNLTAITDPEGIAVRHFIDSATLLAAAEMTPGASLIDVGSGAGFPGVVAKILRPDLSVTLLDSSAKRTGFLSGLTLELAAPCEIVNARAEEAARDPKLRERFDYASARAVAELRVLCELCLPFVREGGVFAAMKGPAAPGELAPAKRGIAALGGAAGEIRKFTLPDESRRCVILIKKISQTPTKYPRPFAKIAKAPL